MNRHRSLTAGAAALAIALALTLSGAASAAEAPASHGLGLNGIGARIGLVNPEGASSTVALGAHIDAGEIVPNLHLTPYIEYWKVGVNGFDARDFTAAADLNLDFPLQGGQLTPYAGGGIGFHFLHADLPPGIPGDASSTKIGMNIQGGVRNQVMPNLGLFGELKYSFVDSSNQLKVMGGFTYNFIY